MVFLAVWFISFNISKKKKEESFLLLIFKTLSMSYLYAMTKKEASIRKWHNMLIISQKNIVKYLVATPHIHKYLGFHTLQFYYMNLYTIIWHDIIIIVLAFSSWVFMLHMDVVYTTTHNWLSCHLIMYKVSGNILCMYTEIFLFLLGNST